LKFWEVYDSQKTQAENEDEGDLLLLGHLQFENNSDREGIGKEIGQDIQSSVGEVEDVDLDAFSGTAGPCLADRLALEACDEHERECLAHDDCHHHV
jgi:hypothetical protein